MSYSLNVSLNWHSQRGKCLRAVPRGMPVLRPSLTSLESSSTLLPPTNCRKAQKEASQHSASDVARPRKLVTLQDSPLTPQKFKNRPLASHSTPLEPIPPSVNSPKQTMLVQWFCIWCYKRLWSFRCPMRCDSSRKHVHAYQTLLRNDPCSSIINALLTSWVIRCNITSCAIWNLPCNLVWDSIYHPLRIEL